jgi:chemotaxis protein methyltransferase CheR
MTNNETWFFRDLLPFEALRTKIIPALITSRNIENTLRIWSAACSSGQEPYSLVMMIKENFPERSRWRVQVLATDICSSVLQKAERGRNSRLEINHGLPAVMLSRYFTRQGIEWKIVNDIRDKVEFRFSNLADSWPTMPAMDIVLLRNVLIYFDVEKKKQILAKVRRLLCRDGYMLMDGAETTLNLDENYERVRFENTAYYRLRS